MKRSGQITVFLSLILLCVCGLLCGLLESARMAGARLYLQTALYSSMDSLFSRYHSRVWEDYRLFLLEYEEETQVQAQIGETMSAYLQTENWYPAVIGQIQVTGQDRITDRGGFWLKEEIADYMKYGIWESGFSQEEAETLTVGLKEAAAVWETSSDYGDQTIDMLRLEEAAEAAAACLNRQNETYDESMSCLHRWDGSGFVRHAKTLKKELEQIPKLVAAYEAQAEKLEKRLEEIRSAAAGRAEDLSVSVREQLNRELQIYEDYIAEDGVRRQEIRALEEWSRSQVSLTEQAIETAEQVMDALDEWEPSEEEEEPDYASFWQPVILLFSGYEKKTLGSVCGTADKEKQGLLEQLKRWAQGELLWLVMPEGSQISETVIHTEQFPSLSPAAESTGGWTETVWERALFAQYAGMHLDSFRGAAGRAGLFSREETAAPGNGVSSGEGAGGSGAMYELEYLIGGQDWDAGNLQAAVTKIFQIRQGLNLIYLLSDSAKREEARQLAALIVGAAGLLPLVSAMTFFILAIWAMGEAVADLRALLKGGKISLIKNRENWKTSLENLLEMGREKGDLAGEDQTGGLSYTAYLKLALLLTETRIRYYRLMDMIQMNIRDSQDSFRMENCRYQVEIQVSGSGKHVFLTPWFVDNPSGKGTYSFTFQARKAY